MEKQNITLSLPKDVLQKVKFLAARQETSVSGLLTRALEEIVSREEGYEAARRSHLAQLETGLDLGTRGARPWIREELHAG
jgi:predicted transcriptional regulator